MNLQSRFSAPLALLIASCVQNGAAGGASGDMSGVPSESAAASIHCTYAYRQTNVSNAPPSLPALELDERSLVVAPGETLSESLGQLTLTARHVADEFDGNSFNLSVASTEGQVFAALYQFGAGPPQNQFVGGHGFTGLLYFTHPTAGGDYQAFCEVTP